jgi:hypothetical protein
MAAQRPSGADNSGVLRFIVNRETPSPWTFPRARGEGKRVGSPALVRPPRPFSGRGLG